MTDASKIVGIDLGTTYSLVSVLVDGRPVIIPNVLGESLTPSAVSLDEDGHVLVGAAARSRVTTHPDKTAVTFKRDMGTSRKVPLGRTMYSPEALSACVLGALKADAEAFLGCPVEEAVITVPAYFGELQRQATRAAGAIAGLRVERIVNEPTAAALAYGLHNLDTELKAVVLDLGGGTFDVTVLEIMEGVIEIQSSAGDSRLGGEDFTAELAALAARFLLERGLVPADDPETQARIHDAAEHTKRRLSGADDARFVLPGLKLRDGGQTDVDLTISRAQAEQAWATLLNRVEAPIFAALREAQLRPADVDEVLFVGGSTRLSCMAQLCARLFGRLPKRDIPADEGVALGAAIQAGLKAGEAAVSDLIVTDVAPFSMGIATASHLGNRLVMGVFSPILERGTVIPVSRSEIFCTLQDNQRLLEVEVFQGEHAMCKDNTLLGTYKVKGLPRGPAGEQRVEVRFTYDLNGLLEVDMTVMSTGKVSSLVLEQKPGTLTPKQITDARDAMKGLKFHPRDSLPNRTALGRADALYVELRGEPRALLGEAIAALQMALDAQASEAIQQAREQLVSITEQLRSELGLGRG